MTYETLQYVDATGATQEVAFQNLSATGVETVTWTPCSLAPSTFTLNMAQAPEVPIVIPFKSRCVVRACRTSGSGGANNSFAGGTILFQGRRTDTTASATGGKVSTTITLSDAWWDLMQLTYKVGWREPTGGTIGAPTYTTVYFPDIVLFQADPLGQLQPDGSRAPYGPPPYGGLITDFQQLMAIIYYATNFGSGAEAVQLQMGTAHEFAPGYRSVDTARSVKCHEALTKCLQAHPTVRSWIDHTTTPPTIHFTDQASRGAVTLPYASTDPTGTNASHEATDIQPLPHLQMSRVQIAYKFNGTLNGSPVVNFGSDVYPASGGPYLQTQDYSADLSGLQRTLTQKSFTSASFDPTSLALWRSRVASLLQVSQGGQIPNDGGAGALALTSGSITVEDSTGAAIDYAGTYVYWTDQSVYSWFNLGGTPALAVKATVRARFSYTRGNAQTALASDKVQEHEHTFQILLTNAPTGVYSTLQTTNTGETAPPGLAQLLYGEMSVLQWKLSHRIWQVGANEDSLPAFVVPGRDNVNISGGDPAWATMAAMVEGATVKLSRVVIGGVWVLRAEQDVRCGPMTHLEPDWYLQVWNMFANRNIRQIPASQQTTGLGGQTSDLTATEAAGTAAPAIATMAAPAMIGYDTVNSVQYVVQPDATTGQIAVKQNKSDGTTNYTGGVIAPAYHGTGAPTSSTLPANTYYRTFDRYFDTTSPGAPVEYLCNSAGTNSTSGWAKISGGGGSFGGVDKQTASYAAVAGDNGKLVSIQASGAVTLTLPSTPPSATWMIGVNYVGSGSLTISGAGIPSGTSISNQQGMLIYTDGTNYYFTAGPPISNYTAQAYYYNNAGAKVGSGGSSSGGTSATAVQLSGWILNTCEDDGTGTGNTASYQRIFYCSDRL